MREDSQLHAQVVLREGFVIDKFADIKNSIVMPGVDVGPYLDVTNAIVTGNEVTRIDDDVIIPILDNRLTDAVFSTRNQTVNIICKNLDLFWRCGPESAKK